MIHSKVYISVLILASLIISCQEDNPNPSKSDCVVNENISSKDSSNIYIYNSGKEEYGYATAIKLNKPWRASSYAYVYNNTFYIVFSTFLPQIINPDYKYEKEFFEIKITNITSPCLKLANVSDSLMCRIQYAAVDDDAAENYYLVPDSLDNNFIQLDTLNIETGRVAGKFMCSFVKDLKFSIGRLDNPYYVRFFNGEFHCKIK
ncbi:MAG: hypothetical protein ABIO44_01045 [Saprospiraceae bacterium]